MALCDALLDLRHYSVSLMAFDAFAAGLPIVTLPGKLQVERYALGCYRLTGIDGLVASSADEYVRLALRLGSDECFKRSIQDRIKDTNHLLLEDRQSVIEFERFVEEATCRPRT